MDLLEVLELHLPWSIPQLVEGVVLNRHQLPRAYAVHHPLWAHDRAGAARFLVLFDLGIGQVGTNDVGDGWVLVVVVKGAAVQRHELLQLQVGRHRESVDVNVHPTEQLRLLLPRRPLRKLLAQLVDLVGHVSSKGAVVVLRHRTVWHHTGCGWRRRRRQPRARIAARHGGGGRAARLKGCCTLETGYQGASKARKRGADSGVAALVASDRLIISKSCTDPKEYSQIGRAHV